MTYDHTHTQQLIDRYLDGLTSRDEELQLYTLLHQMEAMPSEWRPIRAMMDYAQAERAACTKPTSMPLETNEHAACVCREGHAPRPLSIARKRWWAAAAIAIALAATTWTLWPKAADAQCFAIIDGQHVTDQHIVEQEAEEALQLVAITDDEALDALDAIN